MLVNGFFRLQNKQPWHDSIHIHPGKGGGVVMGIVEREKDTRKYKNMQKKTVKDGVIKLLAK